MCMVLAPVGDGILALGTKTPYKSARLADDGGTAQPATPTWEPCVGDHFFQPFSTWWGGDNVLGNAAAVWQDTNNGTGSTSAVPGVSGKPFLRRMTAGTTSTGRHSQNTNTSTTFLFSSTSHQRIYKCVFRVPVLSDGTVTFVVRFGYLDSVTTTSPADGAYFEFDANTDAQVQCVTASNSTRTTTDSGFTPVADTFYEAIIVITNDTSVAFYLGTPGATTLVATNTTNIPSGTARTFYAAACIAKSAGSGAGTERHTDVWYQKINQDRAIV